MSADRRIAAYLGHSYRAEDRALNEAFWNMLWADDFTCTVDPQTSVFSAAHVERLIRRSQCVISIVTHRDWEAYYRCSPYMVYEHGLAFLGRKPRLAFVESGVSARYFSETSRVCEFDRERLDADSARFHDALATLREDVGSDRFAVSNLTGKVGLLLGNRERDRMAAVLEPVLERRGYEPVPVQLRQHSVLELATKLDGLDFVVVDVTPGRVDERVHPFIHGRLVPSVRLLEAEAPEAADRATLDQFITGQLLRGVPPADDLVVSWRDDADLVEKIEQQLLRLGSKQVTFGTHEDGLRYFRSRGRQGKKVFVSNANDANPLARLLTDELGRYDIEHFQYQFTADGIPVGSDWRAELFEQVRSSDVFVALVTAAYRDSPWTRSELGVAQEAAGSGLQIVPYFLDDSRGQGFAQQGRNLSGLAPEAQVEKIVRDIDALLDQAPVSVPTAPDQRRPVDIAIITVLPEEYDAVRGHLDTANLVEADGEKPRQHAWQLGTVEPDGGGSPFHVVLARTGEAGQNSAVIACKNTIDRFRPRYVLLVGIAGGFPVDGLRKGDVVLANVIHAYEPGKIDGGFHPRHNFTSQVDKSLLIEAELLPSSKSDWHRVIRSPRPGEPGQPNVHTGVVASGDKVIDDLGDPYVVAIREKWPNLIAVEMEAAGVAAAVRDVTGAGGIVGLAVVRGISDLPPEEKRSAAGQQTDERDAWKPYAAEAAAAFAVQLIRSRWPLGPRS